MLKYARADTHFLLHIYDNLRNALLDRAVSRSASPTSRAGSPTAPDVFVREVLSRSTETALRVYSLEPYDEEGGTGMIGWDTLARKWNKPALGIDGVPGVQREVFRAVHMWRDRVAREEDESTGFAVTPSVIVLGLTCETDMCCQTALSSSWWSNHQRIWQRFSTHSNLSRPW
jgi:exosome complex exonuclease RRP6